MKKLIALSSAFIIAAVSCSAAKTTVPEPVLNENGKYVVTVGAFEEDPFIKDTARHPDGIEVQFVDFSEGYNIDPHDKQQRDAMHMEIDKRFAKGDVPDILLLSPDDVKRLDRLGAFVDLSELMDEYDEIKRDEITDAALAGLTLDGRIPALIKGYTTMDALAKTKFVPREYTNWNIDAAMKFYKEMPEGMIFSDYSGEDGTPMYWMLRLECLNYIDEKNGTCDFSGKFAEILQFCQDNPCEPIPFKSPDYMTQAEKEQYYYDLDHMTRKDDILVYFYGWNGISPQGVYNSFFGQDMTFVGAPSEDGCGFTDIFTKSDCYCITEKCANKEAAWKVVCEMLRTTYNRNGYAVPKPEGISIFKKWINDDYDSYIENLDEKHIGESGVVTKEYFDYVLDYYKNIPANIYRNEDLQNLVWEECLPAVKGERSVEEAIKILNDRVGTYLSERT